jgi:hypothetical protein
MDHVTEEWSIAAVFHIVWRDEHSNAIERVGAAVNFFAEKLPEEK